MDKTQLKAIKKKVNTLNQEDKFQEAIELIESISEEERDLELKISYAHMLNNIGIISLGGYNHTRSAYISNTTDDENSPKIFYIKEAINKLEALKDQGKDNYLWNKRMGYAYYSMGHILRNQSLNYYSLAISYFQRWYDLVEKKLEKKEAMNTLNECREHLADRYFSQRNYLRGFSLVEKLSTGWEDYYPNFYICYQINQPEFKEIDEETSKKLDELAQKGNELLEKGEIEQALIIWQDAINIIPEPKYEKAEVVWFEVSMGDIYFIKKDFHKAEMLFERAVKNSSGAGKESFIFMRYGESLYEINHKITAKEYLLKAYMLDGEEIFKSEEQNLKYLDFLLEELKKDEERKKNIEKVAVDKVKKKKTTKKSQKNKFDENYILVERMVKDNYYPEFLVKKVQKLFNPLIEFLERGEKDKFLIQEKLDEFTISVNNMQDEFWDTNSDIETEARESIGETVEYILNWFEIDIDVEEAIRERDW